MELFKGMRVGSKLIFGFSTMIIFMVMIGLTGYNGLRSIHVDLNEIFSVRLPGMDALIETDRDLQQLLVAERSIIFANARSDLFKTLVENYERNLKQAEDRWNDYKSMATTEEEKKLIAGYEAARKAWEPVSRQIVDGRIADTRQGRRMALDLSLGNAAEKFESMRGYLDQLTRLVLAAADNDYNGSEATFRRSLYTLGGICTAGLLIAIFLTVIIGRGVTGPLRRVIRGLAEAARQLAGGSGQVSSASQSLAEGASEQAASIEETSSSMEEMASMTRQNASNAGNVNSLMTETKQVVGTAGQSMEKLTGSMEAISSASEETSKIIKTIDEIAFQTNLLALNAAVEAARAGEAGAGFAVVADEVRRLAMRAAEAAKNTAELIEGTVKKVNEGSDLVATTSSAFDNVTLSTEKIGVLVSEIYQASDEQARGIEQVNIAITQMDKVVQQNAANAEESASASEELNAQAEQLWDYVNELMLLIARKDDSSGGKSPHNDMGSVRLSDGKQLTSQSRDRKMIGSGAREIRPEQVLMIGENGG